MEPARHLEILRTEGDRLASVPTDSLDAPVPALEGWTIERVLRHTGKVHQWVAAVITSGGEVDTAQLAGIASGPECIDDYRKALDQVVDALRGADPDTPMFTFAGPGTAAFWMRRQAHEVSVHRVDAADALAERGGPEPDPLSADAAADAVDEWATLFLATRFAQRHGPLPAGFDGRTVHLHGTDDPAPPDGAEWLLRFADGAVTVEPTHAKGDVALRGSAQDLLLVLWRRRPLDTLEVFGDRDLAERLLDVARF